MIEIDLKNKPLAQMIWEAPMFREDDTPLDPNTEIGEYRIYYGAVSGDYQSDISIAGNTLYTNLDFKEIALPFYAVMTAVDNDGRESGYSGEVVFVQKMYAPKPPTGLGVSLDG